MMTIEECREFYARELLFAANLTTPGLVEAFAKVPREHILVNCGVTHPQPIWLDRLREGGRLVVPFTAAMSLSIGQGVMFKIVRTGAAYAM